jgi:hypothetical protein
MLENLIDAQNKTNHENDKKFKALNRRLKNIENQVAQQVSATS